MPRGAVWFLGLSLVLHAPAAAAQTEAKAASVAAFDEATQLLAEGKVAEACGRFADSQRLDPQLGTLLNLADGLERNGQTGSAWAAFREAGELAEQRQDARAEVAQRRAQALVPRLSKLRINVSAALDKSTSKVARDGSVIESTLWGAPIPTDPGQRTITVSAPGRREWKTTVTVPSDGGTATVEVPELERLESAAGSGGTRETSALPARESEGVDHELEPSPPRWTALVAGGVGVVGVGLGSVFGLMSKSKHDESEKYCTGTACHDERGVDLADDALTMGTLSTVSFVVGGVGLAAGATLWLLGTPSKQAASAPAWHAGLGPNRFVLERTW